MRVVTRRTGLSADVLRAWERRHAVVEPSRSESGHRLYSDADIERLRLLYQATAAGRGIGQVAALPPKALAALVRQDASADTEAESRVTRRHTHTLSPPAPPSHSASEYLDGCLLAIKHLDATALAATLGRAAIVLHATEFLDALVVPLIKRIGTGWRQGTLPPVHGHLARVVLRRWLYSAIAEASSPVARPNVVVATPLGEVYEFEALLAALSAAVEGWRVTYLGTNLPAEHIAEAATLTRARAVALSIEHPAVDPPLGDEFRRLRRALPETVALVVAGAASSTWATSLDEVGAIRSESLADLRSHLRILRRGRRGR
jgi:DNA-binding transcriptional MerR regulator/methylmalonyl-CoA mutase cobalamin-binding subunit